MTLDNAREVGLSVVGLDSVVFLGMRFVRDKKTKYFRAHFDGDKKTCLLHRIVFESVYGQIPEGYHVHHKDGNRENNMISNLVALPVHEHRMIHAESISEEEVIRLRKHMAEKCQPKAIAWHKSDAGSAWHKKHFLDCKGAMFRKVEKTCLYCGAKFTAKKQGKFCSLNCKAAWRRKTHVDDIEVLCEFCGKKFSKDKYKKTRYCSGKCSCAARRAKQFAAKL